MLDHLNVASHMHPMDSVNRQYATDYILVINWTDHLWVIISVLSAALVVVSSIADRRRGRRANINSVGFMPWTGITVLSVLATVISIAMAIKY